MGVTLPKGVHVEESRQDGVLLGYRGRVADPRPRGTWIKGSRADPGSRRFETYAEAEAWARARLDRYLGTFRRAGAGIDGEITRRRLRLDEFGRRWVAGRTEWADHTRAAKRSHLRAWVTALGDPYLDEITQGDIEAYMASTRDTLFRTSRAARLRVLCQLMAVALRDGEILRDPTALVERPKDKGRKHPAQVINDDEMWAAAAQMPPHMGEALVLLGYDSGLREGEIAALLREDVNLDGETPAVSVTKTALSTRKIQPHPKGGDPRVVPLSPRTVAALRAHFARFPCLPGAWVFRNSAGRHISCQDIRKYWQRAREAAGLGKVHFHHLRHSCATHLVRAGAPMDIAQFALGHGNIQTTQRYYIEAARLAQVATWVTRASSHQEVG